MSDSPPAGDATPAATHGPTPTSLHPRRWLSAASGVSPIRLLLGGLGLCGLVLGAVLAWHTASATTLLIVSVVLLALSALGLDWNKIRGTYGGLTLEAFRDKVEAIGAAAEESQSLAAAVATSPEVDAAELQELTDSLDGLRHQVRSLELATEKVKDSSPRARPRTSSTMTEGWDAFLRDARQTTARHVFQRGGETVQLTLNIVPGSGDARYSCSVTTPTGNTYQAVTRRHIDVIGGVMPGLAKAYVVRYPDEFVGSEPLSPGLYTVEWRLAPAEGAIASALVAAMTVATRKPVATDAFTIPDRRSVAAVDSRSSGSA